MTVFEFFSNFFPLVLFSCISLNGLIWWWRGKPVRATFPKRKRSYIRLIFWFVGYTALICLFGQLELVTNSDLSIFQLMRFDTLGTYGKISVVLTLLISPLLALYIYGFKGADELSQHPGLLSKGPTLIPERAFWMMLPVLVFFAHGAFVLQASKFAG